mmetsp:Transcript_107658/g.309895  ORF Transcript_107658/g.309895 Transcript_107658/m.309895 type:complete len:121 (+) Transcript_107658:536-898(+)
MNARFIRPAPSAPNLDVVLNSEVTLGVERARGMLSQDEVLRALVDPLVADGHGAPSGGGSRGGNGAPPQSGAGSDGWARLPPHGTTFTKLHIAGVGSGRLQSKTRLWVRALKRASIMALS